MSAGSDPSDISGDGWKAVGKRVLRELREDQIQGLAAGLAFYALLAVFPALIAFVSIYGLVADPQSVTDLMARLSSGLPEGAGTLIAGQLERIVQMSGGALSWTAVSAIVGALWSASSGAQQLIKALDRAYDIDESRGFFKLRGVSIVLTLMFFVLGGVAIGLIVVVPPLLASIAPGPAVEIAVAIGRFIVLAALLMVVLAAVYRYAPDREEPRWEWVSPGAVVGTIVWIVASILFSIYVSNFGNFGQTYGSLAGVIILMLWLFISAFVVLAGAELNAESEDQVGAGTDDRRQRVGVGSQ